MPTVPESYQIPSFVLTLLLLPGLGYLWLRFRDRRSLLWFFSFLLAFVRTGLHSSHLYLWDFSNTARYPWLNTVGEIAALLSSALFIAALAPARAYVGRFRLPLPILYTLPAAVYTILYIGVMHEQTPDMRMSAVYLTLAGCSAAVAMLWALTVDEKRLIPRTGIVLALIVLILRGGFIYFRFGPDTLLVYAECAAHFMTAWLLILRGRRFSPGVILGALGFLAWSLAIVPNYFFVAPHPELVLMINRCVVMAKVLAALGLLLMALEDQLAVNQAARERERRARRELEAYAKMPIAGRRVDDFDAEASRICEVIAANSRFSRTGLLLLRQGGAYRLAGSAGLDGGIAPALDSLARRILPGEFLAAGSQKPAIDGTETYELDFTPWLTPGDDLRRLNFTSCLALPMRGQSTTEGALLLSGLRGDEPLAADDLLPTEILASRMQAIRSQTRMQEQLVESEKFAVLGQLAGNVSQQLNNPLTVILGYSSLLADSLRQDESSRKGAETILSAARMMRSTIESLHRMVRGPGSPFTAVSVAEILADMEQLFRPEFQRRSIDFRVSVAPDLPDAICQPQPLRQAMLHGLQYAMAAAESSGTTGRAVRVEATSEGGKVQILVAHSGAAFPHPERAFDLYSNVQPASAASAGLSLCALLIREINGRTSAVNLDPSGAAILMELTAERRKKPR